MKRISAAEYLDLTDPVKRYRAMAKGVQLLHDHKEYVATLCLIACYLDDMATSSRHHTKKDYVAFLKQEFTALCTELGGHVFYAKYRSGLVHGFSPEAGFALAEDHETDSDYAGECEVEGRPGRLTALNVDRLAREFFALAERKARAAKEQQTTP